jgi:hypothetical protein
MSTFDYLGIPDLLANKESLGKQLKGPESS